ncbi:MAG: serine/threonine-protein kinase [Archangium sp.]|nr:serine/threonine-protein kinase [Archangium sp.]
MTDPQDDTPGWAPGNVVGAYTLLAKLATGGMAEIWLARQVGLRGFERLVVVKRIIESLSQDEAFVEMFLDEARIVVQLTHPNIVQVFDLGEHAGAYYIAMEYLAGENLVSVARAAAKAGAPLDPKASVKIAIAALEGLSHAHHRAGIDGKPLNVVHRDVSPHNIVLTWDGQVKLVDFGIARAANRATQTQGHQLKGKFAYMAPEQAQGDSELDARVDVFAMGVVLWEMVTHRRLFSFDDQIRILKTLISDDPIEAPHERSPGVPVELSNIIMKALDKRLATRFQSAQDFKAALEAWLQSVGGGPTTSELGQLMNKLFKARIAERTQLIEKAARGEVSLSKVGEVMKPPTDRSMPSGTPSQMNAGVDGSGNLKLGIAAVGTLALVLMAGAVSWKVLTQGPPEPTPDTVVEVLEAPPPPSNEPKVVLAVVEKSSSIMVETEPAGATITIDGKTAGTAPLTLSEITPGEHAVEAALAGYSNVKRTVTASAEGDRLMVVLTLTKKEKAEVARGKLSLSTDPWTHVSLNGRVLGDTPLIEVALPAGRHRLQLSNEQAKIDLAIEVEVKAGQVTKKVLRL